MKFKSVEEKSDLDRAVSPKAVNTYPLYPGITVSYLTLTADSITPNFLNDILQINYCRLGCMDREMEKRDRLCLKPGNFSLHTQKASANSLICVPTGIYEGLTVSIDLKEFTCHPPEILSETGITGDFLASKFCKNGSFTVFSRNETTEQIFSAFYHRSKHFFLPYQKIKILELLLYLSEWKDDTKNTGREYPKEQVDIIHEIHEQLIGHMEQRVTIETLSKQYLINPTTLKTVFKSVYGTSIAAHIKEHRMEQAAKLLQETNLSIAEIAGRVGYDSQSKFTSAFKETFGLPPKAFRKTLPPI